MDFFGDDNGGHIGFGGNVSGTLNPSGRKKLGITKARIKRSFGRFQVSAPPFIWGGWQEVFAQFGVIGPDADRHVTRVNLSLSTDTQAPSSFDYEIKGGDYFIRGVAGGFGASESVTITGNVATSISVRAKSHSSLQKVVISVS